MPEEDVGAEWVVEASVAVRGGMSSERIGALFMEVIPDDPPPLSEYVWRDEGFSGVFRVDADEPILDVAREGIRRAVAAAERAGLEVEAVTGVNVMMPDDWVEATKRAGDQITEVILPEEDPVEFIVRRGLGSDVRHPRRRP
ncbi:MAG: hypothetical protein AB7Q42_06000 [Acidimicrobiia bacterium]